MRPASNVTLRNGVWDGVAAVVVVVGLELTKPSRDMRVRVLDAAAPGSTNSPSYVGFARGVFDARCESVDFRSAELRRTGELVFATGELKEKPAVKSLYWRGASSMTPRELVDWSKMLSKSLPRLETLWRLLRLAMGLEPELPLRFIKPSLRFSGLDLAGGAGDKSGRRANSNLMGLSLTPRRLSMSMPSGDSALRRRTGAGVFSWPAAWRGIAGVVLVALAVSLEDSPRTRRRGLLELLLRVRGDARNGCWERRSENFFLAGAVEAPRGESG